MPGLGVHKLPGNVVRIQFPRVRADTGKAFAFEAGQYAFLCVPSLSKLPFTISSALSEPVVTFRTKVLGDWTKRVFDQASGSSSTLALLVDGPYDSTSVCIESVQASSHVRLISTQMWQSSWVNVEREVAVGGHLRF